VGDRNLDEQPATAYRWALPIRAEGAELEKLPPYTLTKPQVSTVLNLDSSAGLDLPAPVKGQFIYRGDLGTVIRLTLQSQTPAQREETLRKAWKGQYDWIEPRKVGFTVDEATGDVTLTMEGTAKMEWAAAGQDRRYETDGSSLGWKSRLKRDGGPHPDAPFAVNYPDSSETIETIVLPSKGAGFTVIGDDFDRTVGVWRLTRTAAIHDGVFTMHAESRALAREISAADAAASAAPLAELRDNEVYVQAGLGYRPTVAELADLDAQTPTTADSLVTRADIYSQLHDFPKAIADLDAAIKLKPDDAHAYADRGVARFWTKDYEGAAADAQKALALNPREALAYNVQGLFAWKDHNPQKAIDALTRSLELAPSNNFTLIQRAQIYIRLGEYDRAAPDVEEALKNAPDDPNALDALAWVLQGQGKYEEALKTADRLAALAPDTAEAHLDRANSLLMLHRKPEAKPEFEAALKIEPSAAAYLGRAQTAYTPDQLDNAIADVDQALKLDPDMYEAHLIRANLLIRGGKAADAIGDTEILIARKPDDPTAIAHHVAVLSALHRNAEVFQFISKLRTDQIDDPHQLNLRCWTRATLNKDLDLALADCDAALKLDPGLAAALDSRGFVHFRLGQYDAAIADYSAALKLSPELADSLFGRGLSRLKKGQQVEGMADLAAARGLKKDVDAEFASYGVKADEAQPAS
jgi:tetratricopeptide (TPR) repeat protein